MSGLVLIGFGAGAGAGAGLGSEKDWACVADVRQSGVGALLALRRRDEGERGSMCVCVFSCQTENGQDWGERAV